MSGSIEDSVAAAWPEGESLSFADSAEFFRQGDEAAHPSDWPESNGEPLASTSLEDRERRRVRFIRLVAIVMGGLSVMIGIAVTVHSRREPVGPIAPPPVALAAVPDASSEPVVLDIPMVIAEPAPSVEPPR